MRVYLDNHATTPMDPRVFEAMRPYFVEKFGNASSRNHFFGWEAEEAVEAARKTIARCINADPDEIIFTSGATESINLAIKGLNPKHIVTLATEHKAVLDTCETLRARGTAVTVVPVEADGLVDLQRLEAAITSATSLVSVLHVNNEIGVIQPIEEIGRLCKKRGVMFHSDGAQAVGRVPVDVQKLSVDLYSMSAHKVYGPKGVGALYVRKHKPRVKLQPLIDGGGHERGLRSGTLNVPAIVGMAKAFEIAAQEMPEESRRILALRERLRKGILSRLDYVTVNGSLTNRVAGNLNVSIAFVEGESLLMRLNDQGIAVSTGSACSTANLQPSHVLKAIGVNDQLIHSSIRFGIGRFNTEREIDYVLDALVESVKKLRAMSPLADLAKDARSNTFKG